MTKKETPGLGPFEELDEELAPGDYQEETLANETLQPNSRFKALIDDESGNGNQSD